MKIRYIAIAVAAACVAGAGHAEILSLHAAWQKAVATEPAWRVAQADASIDRAESAKARAGLLPQVGLSGSRNRNSLTQSSNTGGASDYGSSSTSLSLRQPLFRMQSYAEYQRAGARSEGAEFRLDNEAQSLAVRVSQAYFEVLQSEDAIRHAAYLEQSLATHVDAARKAFRSGSGTRIDIDEARARLALATSDRQAAENANGNAKKRLSAIVGLPVTELLPLDEDRIKGLRLVPAAFADWVELARQKSPELAAAAKSVDEASWSVKTARSGHLPTLDLVMSRSKADSDSIATINNAYTANTIGVQLNIPIFSGGFTTADTTQAAARYQRAIAARDNTDRQLETRLLQEFNGVMQGEERLASLATALEASREALRATHHGVAAGTRTSLDVLNAERQLYATRLDISKARYDWLMSRIRLHALAGRLGEAEIREVSGLLSLAAGRDRADILAAGAGQTPAQSPPPRDSVLRSMPAREVGAAGYANASVGAAAKADSATPNAAGDPVASVAVGKEPAVVSAEPKLATSLGAAVTPAAPAAETATPVPPTSDAGAAQAPGTMAKIGAFLSGLFVSTDQPSTSTTAAPAEPQQPADVTPADAAAATPTAIKPLEMPAEAAVAAAAAPTPAPTPAAAEARPAPAVPAAAAEDARKAPIIQPRNNGAYVVALGAYAEARNVRRVLNSAGKIGIAAYTEALRSGLTRVRAGPFATRQAANNARNKLKAGGIAGVVDKR